MRHSPKIWMTLILSALVFTVLASYAKAAVKHPIEVERAVCGECHPGKWSDVEHTAGYIAGHKFPAQRDPELCTLCHRLSFCADCHVDKEELKPSEKYTASPWRELPHRGDYLTQHTIDGRINPAPCFRCHGRAQNEKCKRCHR